jgi:hypothetical protein
MFKSPEGFWQNLAEDEQRHADWLVGLRSNSITEKLLLCDSRLKFQAINTSIGYVENQIARAKEENLSLLQALSIAKYLESALLEKQFFKIQESTPKEIRSVMVSLTDETEKHLNTVVELLASEKRRIS